MDDKILEKSRLQTGEIEFSLGYIWLVLHVG